jgi:hypothetical protein
MSQKIPSQTGADWGQLHAHGAITMPARSAQVLGACVDMTVEVLETIELQILFLLNVQQPQSIRDALWIYFAMPETRSCTDEAHELLGNILNTLRTVRLGIEAERGTLEIRQTNPDLGTGYKGYVTKNLLGTYGPVHMDFKNIMSTDIQKGAAYFMNLYVHEATHRYAHTIDVPVGRPAKLAYLSTSSDPNILTAYRKRRATEDAKDSRRFIVGELGALLTTEQALTNADSFSWFVQVLLQDHEDSLSAGLKLKKRALRQLAAQFEREQRLAMEEMFQPLDPALIAQMGSYFSIA